MMLFNFLRKAVAAFIVDNNLKMSNIADELGVSIRTVQRMVANPSISDAITLFLLIGYRVEISVEAIEGETKIDQKLHPTLTGMQQAIRVDESKKRKVNDE